MWRIRYDRMPVDIQLDGLTTLHGNGGQELLKLPQSQKPRADRLKILAKYSHAHVLLEDLHLDAHAVASRTPMTHHVTLALVVEVHEARLGLVADGVLNSAGQRTGPACFGAQEQLVRRHAQDHVGVWAHVDQLDKKEPQLGCQRLLELYQVEFGTRRVLDAHHGLGSAHHAHAHIARVGANITYRNSLNGDFKSNRKLTWFLVSFNSFLLDSWTSFW